MGGKVRLLTNISSQTKAGAKKEYHLNEEQLFADQGDGLPIIKYGTHSTLAGSVTVFARSDVERVAEAVHGDWRAHVEKRARRKCEARKRMLAIRAKCREERSAAKGVANAASGTASSTGSGTGASVVSGTDPGTASITAFSTVLSTALSTVLRTTVSGTGMS